MSEKIKICPICGGKELCERKSGEFMCLYCDTIFRCASGAEKAKSAQSVYEGAIKSVFEIYSFVDDDEISGTGVMIPDGHILTSAHVVMKVEAGERVVNFNDGLILKKDERDDAMKPVLVRADPDLDLALLRADGAEKIDPIPISKGKISAGDRIYVIGNSKGEGLCIVDGIVSDAVRRINGRELMMISAPVTTGCSGAPVLNSDGELVGVVTGGREGAAAMNYAVPVGMIEKFLKK